LDDLVGRWKELSEEWNVRGFSHVEGHLCLAHIADDVLRNTLRANASSERCDFCDEAGRETAEMEALLHEVVTAIRYFYTDALELPWDGEAGQYAGPVSDVDEVVEDVCSGAFTPDVSDEVAYKLIEAIGADKQWTGWGAAGDAESLDFHWERYADAVRSGSRFVHMPPKDPASWPMTPPGEASAFLQQLLVYVDGPLGLVGEIPRGTAFYRGRLVESRRDFRACAKELGSAPSDRASTNRMSAVGISFFYSSADPLTAIAEIAGHGVKPMAMVANFQSTRVLKILDLTRTPHASSPFDDAGRAATTMAVFLESFVREVTKPVIPDERVHLEYVPTQVLTEYLRWVPEAKIDGIAVPSSQTGHKTFVLFFGPEAFADDPPRSPAKQAFPLMEDEYEESPTFTLADGDVALYEVSRMYRGTPAGGLVSPVVKYDEF
jgi:RES domain/HEPN/RES N-terminal domain 1